MISTESLKIQPNSTQSLFFVPILFNQAWFADFFSHMEVVYQLTGHRRTRREPASLGPGNAVPPAGETKKTRPHITTRAKRGSKRVKRFQEGCGAASFGSRKIRWLGVACALGGGPPKSAWIQTTFGGTMTVFPRNRLINTPLPQPSWERPRPFLRTGPLDLDLRA